MQQFELQARPMAFHHSLHRSSHPSTAATRRRLYRSDLTPSSRKSHRSRPAQQLISAGQPGELGNALPSTLPTPTKHETAVAPAAGLALPTRPATARATDRHGLTTRATGRARAPRDVGTHQTVVNVTSVAAFLEHERLTRGLGLGLAWSREVLLQPLPPAQLEVQRCITIHDFVAAPGILPSRQDARTFTTDMDHDHKSQQPKQAAYSQAQDRVCFVLTLHTSPTKAMPQPARKEDDQPAHQPKRTPLHVIFVTRDHYLAMLKAHQNTGMLGWFAQEFPGYLVNKWMQLAIMANNAVPADRCVRIWPQGRCMKLLPQEYYQMIHLLPQRCPGLNLTVPPIKPVTPESDLPSDTCQANPIAARFHAALTDVARLTAKRAASPTDEPWHAIMNSLDSNLLRQSDRTDDNGQPDPKRVAHITLVSATHDGHDGGNETSDRPLTAVELNRADVDNSVEFACLPGPHRYMMDSFRRFLADQLPSRKRTSSCTSTSSSETVATTSSA
ncbi:uncharacterized protein MONBRDRAFT_32748 [Monosiga brevicollis MX1]|uniref:Uncharacterized protein n=1 Tax=Monosiga brevicollis TaxID=81824 RepID=A9V1G2_MONBE|nr:uncharacterized protein MONBRDRAFT_32748 [Monosiga brevicollis MX1]EDQ88561.1 predicted protein [Monosiga brevicollis MX1]|eukprot:XP_001746665.1 hypothetical protein [Monosiga brevicollis MX1]